MNATANFVYRAAAPPPEEARHRVVQAALGPPLEKFDGRRRPVGRIGGLAGRTDPDAVARLTQALEPGPQILEESQPGGLVADWDCCWLDGRPVRDFSHWLDLIRAGWLDRVEGAFALAWLSPDGTLTLARDGVGERTLYYAPLPDGVGFARSVRALLATGLVERTLHLPAVATYLTYAYLPGRETLVKGVYELLPGEAVRFGRGRETSRRLLWSVPAEGEQTAD